MAHEPPPHSKVSLNTNQHFDLSAQELMSTQHPRHFAPEPAMFLGCNGNTRWAFQESM